MVGLTDLDITVFADASAFRRWLTEHASSDRELWVGYYKKAVPKTSITYPQAVDEALCFGWIDGITRRIDDEVYANRFTPRRRGSTWSPSMVRRAEALIAEGRMTPSGLVAFAARRPAKPLAHGRDEG